MNKTFRKIGIFSIVLAILLLTGIVIAFYYGWFGRHLFLLKTDFNYLPGWQQDDHNQALLALQKSCSVIAKQDPKKPFSSSISQSATFEDWQKICLAADQVDKNDPYGARKFFENLFIPYHVFNNLNSKGLFTGYYLPTLKCSLIKDKKYNAPIYAIPDDWVKVDLGVFDEKLKGRTIVGQVKNNRLERYPDSAAIIKGAIGKNAKVLAWCDNKIDVAFAHVQGSAIVQLAPRESLFQNSVPVDSEGAEDKIIKSYFPVSNFTNEVDGNQSTMCVLPEPNQFLVGYEGSNGRTYTAIGKVLINKKELTPLNSSMQDIRAWFVQHPEKIDSILSQNPSYVFFRILKNDAPLGSQQVPLTPERSLAVDKKYIPLGAPIWLDAVVPEDTPFSHLLIAQDTGGAIKGIIRGDVYWGGGEKAEFIAGHMKSQGSYWILLPRIK